MDNFVLGDGAGGAEGGDKLEMTIRPRGGNLHENRWRATARPRVHSARIDVRCARVCA